MQSAKLNETIFSPAYSKNNKTRCPHGHRVLLFLLAAAAEDQYQSDNNDPESVIVKKIAKTVVHK